MEMTVILTFTSLFCVMFLLIGLIGGWIFKQNQLENIYGFKNIHPEMFDSSGKLIADEIVALKIQPDFYDEFNEEYKEFYDEEE